MRRHGSNGGIRLVAPTCPGPTNTVRSLRNALRRRACRVPSSSVNSSSNWLRRGWLSHRCSTKARKQLLGVAKSGRIEVAAHGDALLRAEAIWCDEDACHVAAARALVSNEALVVGSRRDAQQLVHRALAPRA